MPTKAELKRLSKPIKMKIRRGDRVMIISGKDKGEIGFVALVAPKENKAIVLKENEENPEQPLPLNAAIKHRKRRTNQEK
jgi:large subunit ribosomal protein L24